MELSKLEDITQVGIKHLKVADRHYIGKAFL